MKRSIFTVVSLLLIVALSMTAFAKSGIKNGAEQSDVLAEITAPQISAPRGCLIEASSGKILYSKDPFDAAPLASVTKIMTLLLVCEALETGSFSLTDKVTVSSYAASMGGSQVFLEEGERISVEDLIKCAVIASANDASVALAELTCGSESAFVGRMNERAAQMGLRNTHFENTTGLDDTARDHYSCAFDIAAMSQALISHDIILKYSSIWQDTIRGGEFTLTNTNRLVRYYDGCNGLKTGSTDKAGYCVSATARRGNMQLIAVVMGAESRDVRNNDARALLDFGFANYALYEKAETYLEDADVLRGVSAHAPLYSAPFSCIVPKSALSRVEVSYDIPSFLQAPVLKGDSVGTVKYSIDGEEIGKSEIYVGANVEAIKLSQIYKRILMRIFAG